MHHNADRGAALAIGAGGAAAADDDAPTARIRGRDARPFGGGIFCEIIALHRGHPGVCQPDAGTAGTASMLDEHCARATRGDPAAGCAARLRGGHASRTNATGSRSFASSPPRWLLPGERSAGRRDPEGVPRRAHSRGRARRRDQPFRRRAARSGRRRAVARQVQADPRDRSAGAHGDRAARRAQPRHFRSGGRAWPLLRAGPVVADRVLDRRQCRRERGRRALPQVRAHRAQRAPRPRRARSPARSSSSAAMRWTAPATTCWR